jgi:hypothetical protein
MNINQAYSQLDTIPSGAYRNCVDFSNKKILYDYDFKMIKKESRAIPEFYEVKLNSGKINKKALNKLVYCIFDGNNFYLNLNRYGMANGFVNLGKPMEYCYFKGTPIRTVQQDENQLDSYLNYGLFGYAVAHAIISNKNKDHIHYVLEVKKGMIDLLSKNYMLRILEQYPVLLEHFQQEEENESLEVLLKYLDLVNLEGLTGNVEN